MSLYPFRKLKQLPQPAPVEVQPSHATITTTQSNFISSGVLPPLSWKQRLSLVAFGIVLSLGLLEIGFRLFTFEFPPTPIEKNRPKLYFYPEGTESMRDYLYSYLKPANTYRIAVVGDSFSFGTAMHFDDTFSKRLERILNLNRDTRHVEVLNFGVPGYSSAHEVRMVKRAVKRQADLIIVQVTLNDPEVVPLSAAGNNAGFPEKPNLDSALYRHWKSLAFVRMRVWNTLHQHAYIQYYADLYNSRKTWASFHGSFERMKQIAEQNGVKIAVVVFPIFSHRLDASYPFESIHQKIDKMLESRGLPYLDLRAAFTNMPNELLQIIPGGDSHPNEIAHRIAAEHIYHWLETSGILPADLYVRNQSNERVGLPYRLKLNESLDTPPKQDKANVR